MSPADAARHLASTPRLLVALDFDGTLSPLVDVPMDARMDPRAAQAVHELTRAPHTTVAFVSGRSLPDLRVIAEHDDSSPIFLAGSHGAEHWVPGGDRDAGGPTASERAERDRLREKVEQIARDYAHAWIEPKTFGFAVPSRTVAVTDRAELHARIDALVASEAPMWRRRTGHDIVEYAFRDEGKDTAIAWLREQTAATAVLFAGDDITDEDAIRSLHPGDVGVRVGPGESAAAVRVAGIPELAEMLVLLAHERASQRE